MVAVALVAAGFAVVAVLRDGLAGTARLHAESAARGVAAEVVDVSARDVRTLEGLDTDSDEPAQVVGPRGEVLGASESLRGAGPVADFNRVEPESDSEAEPETEPGAKPETEPGAESPSGSRSASARGSEPHALGAVPRALVDGGDDGPGDDNSGHGSGNSGHGHGGDDGRDDDPDDDDDHGGDDDSPSPAQPSATPTAQPPEVDRDSESRTVRLHGQDFTLVAVQSRTADDTPVTVYAGASLAEQQQAVGTVTQAMLLGLPLLLLVVGGVTWLVTRRAFQPVEGIRSELAGIMASADLSRRVPEPYAKDEVARLARTTNDTLAALEASVDRQRRFVADASHELRSPIASLRTQLEVGAAHPELLDVEGAVHDTVRLQELATDLLLLARLDAGERPGGGRVSLGALVREELAQQPPGRHPVRRDELAAGEVTGSRGQLARVVINLLQNAQRHAASEVRVSVREIRGVGAGDGVAVGAGAGRNAGTAWVELAVSDDGSGVPEAERERIFERFVRLDDARSRDEGGAGLGLAIARDVATRHGGTLTVAEGSRFVLRLPAAAEAEQQPGESDEPEQTNRPEESGGPSGQEGQDGPEGPSAQDGPGRS